VASLAPQNEDAVEVAGSSTRSAWLLVSAMYSSPLEAMSMCEFSWAVCVVIVANAKDAPAPAPWAPGVWELPLPATSVV
jgi:hypothetical protein